MKILVVLFWKALEISSGGFRLFSCPIWFRISMVEATNELNRNCIDGVFNKLNFFIF